MRDSSLFVAQNQAPLVTAGAAILPYLLPSGVAGGGFIDNRVLTDMGRGSPVYAHFRVVTPFSGGSNGTGMRFIRFFIAGVPGGIFSPTDTDANIAAAVTTYLVAVNPNAILVRSPNFIDTNLDEANAFAELVCPIQPSFDYGSSTNSPLGSRHYFLGFEASVLTGASETAWTAGGVDAWWSPYPETADARRVTYAAGY